MIIQSIIIGIISGVISSLIFLIGRQCIKPKLKISDKITKETDGVYRIKFINKSWGSIEKINLEAFIMKQIPVDSYGNKDYFLKKLDLNTPEYTHIVGKYSKDKSTNNNCLQISIRNLETEWNDANDIFIFQISAFHSVSKINIIKRIRLHCPSKTIVNGRFQTGETFNILNN